MKHVLIIGLFLCIAPTVMGQYYTRDVGFRTGEGTFISFRQFFDEERAVEGMIGYYEGGVKLLGLREHIKPLTYSGADNLSFIYGYGIHIGIDYTNHYQVFYREYYHDWMWNPKFGVDALVGFDYTASALPFVFSVALQPYFEFSLDQYFRIKPLNFVVSFKYRF
ncbi:MAG: hypothetical protein JW801_04835 [Bacteroidales bacterium]|nr:hypothetical protein [Bacteroidales bacterium]